MTTTTATIVRYRVRPGRAEENAGLIRAVYDELHRTRPDGVRYATFRLEAGDEFVHVAQDPDRTLTGLPAFRAFQEGIPERFEAAPAVVTSDVVGTYRSFGGGAADAALAFLHAWCAGDFDRASTLVAGDLAFEGPLTTAASAEEFFALSEPLRPLLRGHRVVRHWEDGDEVCVVYDLLLGDDVVRMTDWLTVRHGLVVADRVLFDTAAFTAVASSSP